jgi:hypothetical protein
VHTTLSRATTEAAKPAAEHGSEREALRQLGIEVDRAKPEAGVAAVCPMLDGGDEESRREVTVVAEAAMIGVLVRMSGRLPERRS